MKRLLLITSAVGLCLAAPAFAQSTPEQDQLNRQKAAPPSTAAPAAQSQDRQGSNQPQMDQRGQAQQRPATGSPSPSAQAPSGQHKTNSSLPRVLPRPARRRRRHRVRPNPLPPTKPSADRRRTSGIPLRIEPRLRRLPTSNSSVRPLTGTSRRKAVGRLPISNNSVRPPTGTSRRKAVRRTEDNRNRTCSVRIGARTRRPPDRRLPRGTAPRRRSTLTSMRRNAPGSRRLSAASMYAL